MTWQPMATAPRDMRPILAFVPGTHELPEAVHIAFRKRPDTYVLQDDDHSIIEPAYWMPLPATPSVSMCDACRLKEEEIDFLRGVLGLIAARSDMPSTEVRAMARGGITRRRPDHV